MLNAAIVCLMQIARLGGIHPGSNQTCYVATHSYMRLDIRLLVKVQSDNESGNKLMSLHGRYILHTHPDSKDRDVAPW